MRIFFLLAALLLGSQAALGEDATAAQGTLQIKISNIENGSGTLYIAILNAPENWLQSDAGARPFRDMTQVVSGTGDVLLNIEDLPPGKYAISLFQDLDGDAELATNMVGFPKEPFGFSAPMGKFGPPSFEEAAIDLPGGSVSVAIALQ
jgi:uncharacterized protein (DUF2141 family)